jgi:hypothetical protein
MATRMGLPMESLSGIFQKKCMKMKKLCDWYAVLTKYTHKVSISSCCSLVPVSLTDLKLLFETFICNWILFQCAESALKSVFGGLDNTYFVGNAPMAHMAVEQTDSNVSSFKVPN